MYIQQTFTVLSCFTWQNIDAGDTTVKRTKSLPSSASARGLLGNKKRARKGCLFLSHFDFVLCVSLKSIYPQPLSPFCYPPPRPSPPDKNLLLERCLGHSTRECWPSLLQPLNFSAASLLPSTVFLNCISVQGYSHRIFFSGSPLPSG